MCSFLVLCFLQNYKVLAILLLDGKLLNECIKVVNIIMLSHAHVNN